MTTFSIPRGTQDFLPADTSIRDHVETVFKEVFSSYGFQRVQTPTFEEFALLSARSGEEIRESMFTFVSDRTEYALRPELTAPVCRLVASGKLSDIPQPYKLYYIGQCFRYGRPQAGRYREFTQAGLELMGSKSPIADAEVMSCAVGILRQLGIIDFVLKVGNIGIFRDLLAEELDFDGQSRVISHIDGIMSTREKCATVKAQPALARDDFEYVKGEIADLYRIQEECQYQGEHEILPASEYTDEELVAWLDRLPVVAENTYRFLWTQTGTVSGDKADLLVHISRVRGPLTEVVDTARSLLKGTPAENALQELEEVSQALTWHGVQDFDVVLGVARGLDFYTGTVFEIDSPLLGAQKQICGGGRYDRLVAEFGGPSIPATGFAFGFDRVTEAFVKSGHSVSATPYQVLVVEPENHCKLDAYPGCKPQGVSQVHLD